MISGIISVDDYLAAQRLHTRHQLRRALAVLVVALLVGLVLVLSLPSAATVFGALLIGAAGGGLIGLGVTRAWILPRKVRRLHAQQATLRHVVTYAWNEAEIEVSWSGGQARHPWADYVRCRENAQVLLLYHNDMLFELVPTSWFADAAQHEAFRRLASRVGASAARAV
ncbi:YcxB family protein [Xanthomonas sp. NCPPB 2654]|uniref:YcxB family protein n=1 Tax=unclassified Xanthomonas TaxID=2643310 RepID=UPI0021E0A7F1|nr:MULTISPECIES: YcxB family protein [unclassified Xanthomonas]MDL5365288.1 YcxB family protein [Xanthomonas sp. NCPPB 2654]UYC19654.1 YcxB family protein [Xanthomonas sp. CFBP 8443]